jgi:exopolysaccharide production protein ExoZ
MKTENHLAYLDGLRGLAIAGVVLVHVGQSFTDLPRSVANLAGFGANGVQLFFVVSGFTLGLVYLSRPLVLSEFYSRRFFRIAPMFYLGVIIYGLLGAFTLARFSGAGETPGSIFATIVFLHGWFPSAVNKVVPGGWSIGAEMMFYASFPLLHWLFRRRLSATWWALSAIVIASLVIGTLSIILTKRVIGPELAGATNFQYYFWLTHVPAFATGLACSKIVKWVKSGPGAAIFYACAFAIVLGAVSKSHLLNFLVIDLLFAGLVLGASASRPRFLEGRAMPFIGVTSFSVYILHFAVVDALDGLLPASLRSGSWAFLLAYIVIFAVSLVLSYLTYTYIEQPFIGFGRRLTKRGDVVHA